jgi:hypothetical protein
MDTPGAQELHNVTAGIRYLEQPTEPLRSLEFDRSPGVPRTKAVYRQYDIQLTDHRGMAAMAARDLCRTLRSLIP